MARQNPYRNDDMKGEAWELGYLAGYAEPETDHVMPYGEELLAIYQEGEQGGRDDRRRLPPDQGGISEEGGGHGHMAEVAEELGLHTLGHVVLHKIFGKVGGLMGLVLIVLEIPGDVQLRPLEEDWSGPVELPDEGDTYVAMCPRTDHPMVAQGVVEGYWAGPGRKFFSEAVDDLKAHGHGEAFVARCSLSENTCGAVWPGSGL